MKSTVGGNKKRIGIIILVAALLFAVIFMDTLMVFRQARQQTWDAGVYQLEIISKEMEAMINDAENLTLEQAVSIQEYLDDRVALKDYLYEQRDSLLEGGTGAFNIYVAGKDWVIIPGFSPGEDYIIAERPWYAGAVRNSGNTYVTSPYQDALTGDICYSVSVLLSDGETVLAVDYELDNIQKKIRQMTENGTHNAVIVTDEGIIAGCADENLIGQQLLTALPSYAGIWATSKKSNNVVSAKIRSDFLNEYLFATQSGNGWYLIVSESDWELYKDSYLQLLITILLSIALFVIVVILYTIAVNNQKRAESALSAKEEFLNSISGELRDPLSRIINISSQANADNISDYGMEMSRIHAAGISLSEMIGQILSYSDIVRTESKKNEEAFRDLSAVNRRFRALILALLSIVMLISLYTNISTAARLGDQLLQGVTDEYEYRLSEWVTTQKSILDMFVSIVSTNPEMLDDYQGTIDFLNRITVQYPEISASYMSSPQLEPSVYMNTGWKPEPGWRVEDRPWYRATMASEDGWSISAPYYDAQTGGYCVTISEAVYDARTGEFLGCFGIDFFMDKLVEILGDSYSSRGYAFLADTGGDIINHPYGGYQMSEERKFNVSELPYGKVSADSRRGIPVRDYDGAIRVVKASPDEVTKFTVYAVYDVWSIYGSILVYVLICVTAFVICFLLVYRMISDLIRMQNETNQKMKDAADAAMAAGRAKSQFLAQMSHEIRTPINAVLGMNEMILRESKDEKVLDYSEDIRSAGRTLLAIINSILDFSKIEDGKMEITPVKYTTAELIHNLENSISERARAKSLELMLEVDENLPRALYGDDVRLSQVIMNLLTNAVKYTEKGSITLTMEDAVRESDSIMLSVSVKDTGIGIRSEDMEKLFESFERLDEKRNRSIEGTGLGMSIVTRLLKMMDSELKVESVYGEGSVFSFVIRQGIADGEPIGDYSLISFKGREAEKHTATVYAPKACVLVTDDNQMNLKVAKYLLNLSGIMPDLASSGQETLEMTTKKSYNIIFLDHMMPGMDGIETLNKLREDKLIDERTAVIALTANAVVGSREKYLKAGFDDYLSKPIEVAQLESLIYKYLPVELLQEVRPEEKTEDEGMENKDTSSDPLMDALGKAGVDCAKGLDYCADDREIYTEVIKEYADDSAEKNSLLKQYYDEENWPEYRIIVHSLKSASKTIGADEVSRLALELENASAEEDAGFIKEHHDAFMLKYNALCEVIKGVG
ncbi:MAG: response regulator [Lachnospiraceae bacterium]|nr:response regulator [Lachnospiraceae bacterium]